MTKVEIRNLRKSFNDFEVLKGVNLTVESGELVALLGPTGAGKTTLFKCIAGIEQPDGGEILFDGESVLNVPPWRREVAMFFQTYALYPTMSVYDNIAYPLRQRKVSEAEISKTVKQVAEKLRITHVLDRKEPATLSGGEMQRVALARTLVRSPRVFLLDEPISNLDAKLREEMRAEFKRIHREFGQTLVYATPDFLEAFAVAEKVAVIRDGQIIQYDTPINIYRKPKNRFVATFVGSPTINIIRGVIVQHDHGWRFKSSSIEVDLEHFKPSKAVDGSEIELAIRPHDIMVDTYAGKNTFKAKVLSTEKQGHQTILTVKLGDHELKTSIKGMKPYRYGDSVTIGIDSSKSILFDVTTGEVIS